MNQKDFYTTSALAGVLKISRQSVLKRMHNGSIKARKMGRNFVIFKKDIDLKKINRGNKTLSILALVVI